MAVAQSPLSAPSLPLVTTSVGRGGAARVRAEEVAGQGVALEGDVDVQVPPAEAATKSSQAARCSRNVGSSTASGSGMPSTSASDWS